MCAKIIEARVRQKKDTLPNWMANPLILLDGEQAFVVNYLGMVTNFRIGDGTRRFSELPDIIQYDQSAFIAVDGFVLPSPSNFPSYTILSEGVYTHENGNITVPSGHWGLASWGGSAWSFRDFGELPSNASKAIDWTAGTYDKNTIVTHNGKQWISLSSTSQEPSDVSNDWKEFGANDSMLIGRVKVDTTITMFLDGNEDIVAEIDKEGNFHSGSFPNGLVHEFERVDLDIEDIRDIIYISDVYTPELLLDANKDILRETKQDGSLIVPGLEKSVQDEINDIKSGGVKSYSSSSKVSSLIYEEITDESSMIMNKRPINGLSNFALPLGILPQKLNFPVDAVKTISAPLSSTYVPIKMMNGSTMNNDSGVVHPNVFYFDFPVNGYKYWMTLNGYPNELWEITWLYGTNNEDLTGWELISGVPQPFEDNPPLVPPYISSHDSDSFITYDVLRGEILIVWRRTMRWHPTDADKQTNEYRYRSSNNGTTWSDVKQFINPNTSNLDLMQSASVIYNPSDRLYYYFDVYNTISPGWRIKVRTNKDIQDVNGWSEYSFISTPSGVVPWHLEVKWIGDAVVLLLHQNQLNSPGNDKLWFAASKDMINWTWSENDVFGGTTPLYKASFIPIYNADGTMKFRIAYTTDERAVLADQWKLKITDTNSFNI